MTFKNIFVVHTDFRLFIYIRRKIIILEFARAVFGKSPEGYSGRNTAVETLSEDEDDPYGDDISESISIRANLFGSPSSGQGYSPAPGGPFSALTPSMWPQDLLATLAQPEDSECHPDYRFDEFGFRVDEEDGPEQNSSKLLSIPFVEDPQHRLQWIAYLEFTHNNEVGDLTWDKVEPLLPRSEKLGGMIRQGIPHSLRPQLWIRLSGAMKKKLSCDLTYKDVVKASSNDHVMTSKQIEKDLLRTLPSNACFSHMNSTGIPRLRRILRGLAWLYPDIGYCQGTGVIAALLLLFLEEKMHFLAYVYYNKVLKEHDIELSLITLHWSLTLFASVVHTKILLRIWDLFFYEGSVVLFQVTLGMLKLKEPDLRILENSAQIFNALSDIPGEVEDVDKLFEVSQEVAGSLNDMTLESHRRKHLAYLMADQGALLNPENARNLPKQHLNRRQLKRSKSMLQLIIFGDGETEDDIRSKNVRQTEILVDLREAILQVARHFQSVDPKVKVNLIC
ncbi:small G protein signaling modulator 3 homolog [Caerostris extrusa]|uniref:Small G protein signaling modulator 3 homolog n=1 Tax=Caerostris extrusa TaxID=172846 RepID=A0AAV4MA82_CAEEX|nr:small G protein signaling modulator 3 homolog [Caerostris extrusa]